MVTLGIVGDVLLRGPERSQDLLIGFERAIGEYSTAICNFESLLHDFEHPPAARSGGTYMQADPGWAAALKRARCDGVSVANNHGGDFGPDALALSMDYLSSAGIVTAGAGTDAVSAAAPAFWEAGPFRIGVVAATVTAPAESRASAPSPPELARPGVNYIGLQEVIGIRRELLEGLATALESLGRGSGESSAGLHRAFRTYDNPSGVLLRASSVPSLDSFLDPQDRAAFERSVEAARGRCDLLIVSVHAHQNAGNPGATTTGVRQLAAAAASRGAHLFVSHGPHTVRGIERLDGLWAFYGLGDFVNLVHRQPPVESPDAQRECGRQGRGDLAVSRHHGLALRVDLGGDPWCIELHITKLEAAGSRAGLPMRVGPGEEMAVANRLIALSPPDVAQFLRPPVKLPLPR